MTPRTQSKNGPTNATTSPLDRAKRLASTRLTEPAPIPSALEPASIAGSMKEEIFQAASNTLRIVAVSRRKWNLR